MSSAEDILSNNLESLPLFDSDSDYDSSISNEIYAHISETTETIHAMKSLESIKEKLYDLTYLEDDQAVLDKWVQVIYRKYLLRKLKQENHPIIITIGDVLKNFLREFRQSGGKIINSTYINKMYKHYFSAEFLAQLKEYDITSRECLKGPLMALVLREYLLDYSKSLKVKLESGDNHNGANIPNYEIFYPNRIIAEFERLRPQITSATDFELYEDEILRLNRTLLVFQLLRGYVGGENNKELFIFIAQLLEGSSDLSNRLYKAGGVPSRERKIREDLFKALTGAQNRTRNNGERKSKGKRKFVEIDDSDESERFIERSRKITKPEMLTIHSSVY